MRFLTLMLFCLIVGIESRWNFGRARNPLLKTKLETLKVDDLTKGIVCCINCRLGQNATETDVAVSQEDCCHDCLWEQSRPPMPENSFLNRFRNMWGRMG